jgi:hypothetical protein
MSFEIVIKKEKNNGILSLFVNKSSRLLKKMATFLTYFENV